MGLVLFENNTVLFGDDQIIEINLDSEYCLCEKHEKAHVLLKKCTKINIFQVRDKN